MLKFSLELHAEAAGLVVGADGNLRRYKKGGIGLGPYSIEVIRFKRITKVVPRELLSSFLEDESFFILMKQEE